MRTSIGLTMIQDIVERKTLKRKTRSAKGENSFIFESFHKDKLPVLQILILASLKELDRSGAFPAHFLRGV
jgi:hypothetical protein